MHGLGHVRSLALASNGAVEAPAGAFPSSKVHLKWPSQRSSQRSMFKPSKTPQTVRLKVWSPEV